ncbi:MAG: DUF6429 family protein, partial [Lysobacterales bacterium]
PSARSRGHGHHWVPAFAGTTSLFPVPCSPFPVASIGVVVIASHRWADYAAGRGTASHHLFKAPDMTYDPSRIDDAVLALLAAFSFDGGRSWKGFDFDVMDRLHAQGFIENPVGKAKSVWITPEGIERGRKLAELMFGTRPADSR